MNEIEKMYENCKIKKQYCGWLDMGITYIWRKFSAFNKLCLAKLNEGRKATNKGDTRINV